MAHLEEWSVVDRDYMGSFVGAAEALKGSTLCLPVDCGAMVWLSTKINFLNTISGKHMPSLLMIISYAGKCRKC